MNLYCDFEFGKGVQVEDRAGFVKYLSDVWTNSQIGSDQEEEISAEKAKQPFFTWDGAVARPKNYIGFVQTSAVSIEIYPKVFRKENPSNEDKKLYLQHIFYWLDYCRKWKFPFTNVNLAVANEVNFPELIMNLMAGSIFEVVSSNPISLYQDVEEQMGSPRGRINFSRYSINGLSNGNHHVLECDYECLTYDNTLNRIIKYCTRKLQHMSKLPETRHILNDIIFILDEVEDMPCVASDLNRVKLNSFFADYLPIIDICRMLLDQQIYSHEMYQQSQWSLLLPMEYIFEDFLAGFIEKHFRTICAVHYQKSDLNLSSVPEAFNMQHDIYLVSKRRKDQNNKPKTVIIDAKYKIRDANFKDDKKRGVSQTDMYQVTSYALRRGCENVIILFPNINDAANEKDIFVIKSGFNTNDRINVTAAEVPFWNAIFLRSDLESKLYQTLSGLLFPLL